MIRDIPSPVTGTIWMVSAAQGQQVFEGNDIMTLESMKMEVPVQAPCDGVITWVKPQGEPVSDGETVARIDDGQ